MTTTTAVATTTTTVTSTTTIMATTTTTVETTTSTPTVQSTTKRTIRSTTKAGPTWQEWYEEDTAYDHRPISFKAWKNRQRNLGRVRRTDTPTTVDQTTLMQGRAQAARDLYNGFEPTSNEIHGGKPPTLPKPITQARPTYKRPEEPTRPFVKHQWHTESTASQVQFRNKGKLIGSLNFAHLVLDINLSRYFKKARGLCGQGEDWAKTMNKTGIEGRQFFIDMVKRYEAQCHRLLYDLEEAEHTWLHGSLDDSPLRNKRKTTHRVKRQFFLVGFLLGAAIVAISSYYFSNSALIDLSVGNSQNPITIRHLQDHEKRITKNERSISILKTQLQKVADAVDVLYNEAHLFHVLMTIETMVSDLVRETDHLLEGLRSLHAHRFSMHLIETSQVVPILKEMKLKLAILGLVPAVAHAEDLYRLECSHMIFTNGTIRIFVHIPAYRKDSLMDLHEYIGTPVHLGNGHFIHPQPLGTYLSSNTANNLFRAFTAQEFALCDRVSDTYYCRNSNWYRKRYQDNCLINLYLHDTDRIKNHCKFVVTKEEEVLTQLNHDTFSLYSQEPSKLFHSCPG